MLVLWCYVSLNLSCDRHLLLAGSGLGAQEGDREENKAEKERGFRGYQFHRSHTWDLQCVWKPQKKTYSCVDGSCSSLSSRDNTDESWLFQLLFTVLLFSLFVIIWAQCHMTHSRFWRVFFIINHPYPCSLCQSACTVNRSSSLGVLGEME